MDRRRAFSLRAGLPLECVAVPEGLSLGCGLVRLLERPYQVEFE